MAWFQLSVYSACLQHSTQINVLIPDHAGKHGPCRTPEEVEGGHDSTKYLFRGVARACGREV